MKELIKRRHMIPLAVWLVVYLLLFVYLEMHPSDSFILVHCQLDDKISYIPAFIYPYLSWFPYIVITAYLAIRYLSDEDYKKSLILLASGMILFLIGCFLWPTGLKLREGLVHDTSTLSGWLMQFIQTVDNPLGVFPSMHVHVTLGLQYALEHLHGKIPAWGIWLGRIDAVLIILSTMFTKQHSILDVIGALSMFIVLWKLYDIFAKFLQTAMDKKAKVG